MTARLLSTARAQDEIAAFRRETFRTHIFPTTPERHKRDLQRIARHLRREAAELDDLADDTNAPYLETERAEFGFELADIVILALSAGALLDIDVGQYVEEKMAINRNREWGEADQSGVIEHVRDVDDVHPALKHGTYEPTQPMSYDGPIERRSARTSASSHVGEPKPIE